MDCCGMPMAAWPGGGLVCVRCQAKVGVPWSRDRNPFARCVENPVTEDMAATVIEEPASAPVSFPVEQPKSSGFGRVGARKGGPK
jgi:hypothetical protein